MIDKAKSAEILLSVLSTGKADTCVKYSLTDETLNRYLREAKKHHGNIETFATMASMYSSDELKSLVESKPDTRIKNPVSISFDCEEIKFLALTDTHIGSKYTNESYISEAIDEGIARGCQFMVHAGDVTEGMSGRDGHVYELAHIGYKEQRKASIELLKRWPKKAYMISGNHDCHSSDTECLTDSGWKHYSELELSDKVLSYDIDKNINVWMPITDIIVKDHDGDMVDFNFTSFKHFVTFNHRMLWSDYVKGAKLGKTDYQYSLASELISQANEARWHFKVSAKSGNSGYPIGDSMLKVVGWLLTDGCISRTSDIAIGNYTIYQSKDPSNIIECLNDAGMKYSHRIRERNITQICGKILKKKPLPEQSFYLYKESASIVKQFLPTKNIQPWMYKLSDRQFDILSQVFLQANGARATNSSRSTTFGLHGMPDFLNEVQILYAMHGYSAQIRLDTRGCTVLDVCKREDACCVNNKGTSVKKYTGKVWCISTPLTNFMIRYKGRPSFTGNCWYMAKGDIGGDIVEDICAGLPDSVYLGAHEGDIDINGVKLRLWHGEDTGSYATSYRLQKLIESFTGGEKPSALITGHTHKAGYFFERNIHAVTAGSIQSQSGWMRRKRLAAHCGFYVITMGIRNKEIIYFEPRFYPFYK